MSAGPVQPSPRMDHGVTRLDVMAASALAAPLLVALVARLRSWLAGRRP